MPLSAVAASFAASRKRLVKAKATDHSVVRWCRELDRVLKVPARHLDLSQDLTEEFRRPGSKCRLKPIQSAALAEARATGGLFAMVMAGGGKTLIGMLALKALLGLRTAVYMAPASGRWQWHEDYKRWSKEFYLPELNKELFFLSHEGLSSKKQAGRLSELRPDLVIIDEAQGFKRFVSARTKRLLRYLRKENPGASVITMSGTITDKSLHDYAHLIELVLRKWSPLPDRWEHYPSLVEWAEAIDVPHKDDKPRSAGALGAFFDVEDLENTKGGNNPTPILRRAYRRRLISTPGVVATKEGEVGSTLYLAALNPKIPPEIADALRTFRKTWCVGDEEIYEAAHFWDVARQISLGFYYVWDWPNGEVDTEWLQARAAWHKEIREFLSSGRVRAGLDSPSFYQDAIERGDVESEAWAAWEMVKDRKAPPKRVVWISDAIARHAVAWLQERPQGSIIWYDRTAFGEKVAELASIPLCAGGDDAKLARLNGAPCVASIRAHGQIKNLQAWDRAAVAGAPAAGKVWEQLLARHHRFGQTSDEVWFYVYTHVREFRDALREATRRAEYNEDTTLQEQRILYATKVGIDLSEEERG